MFSVSEPNVDWQDGQPLKLLSDLPIRQNGMLPSWVAYSCLMHCRALPGLNWEYRPNGRFGIWSRLMRHTWCSVEPTSFARPLRSLAAKSRMAKRL